MPADSFPRTASRGRTQNRSYRYRFDAFTRLCKAAALYQSAPAGPFQDEFEAFIDILAAEITHILGRPPVPASLPRDFDDLLLLEFEEIPEDIAYKELRFRRDTLTSS